MWKVLEESVKVFKLDIVLMLNVFPHICQVGSHLMFFVLPMRSILVTQIIIFRCFVLKFYDVQSKFWVPVDHKIFDVGLLALVEEDGQELFSVGKTFGIKGSLGELSKFYFR